MTTNLVLASVPLWQSVLTVGGLAALIGLIVTVQIWAQRRRRRGEEATTSNTEGAEGMLYRPE